jgi:glyoxylase-like metal-dependent hydrolase (beta-lactamase superfamily II)
MQKGTKTFLIAIGLPVGILILLVAAIGLKFKAEVSKMHPLETKEITSGVYAIKDGIANMFLVQGKDGFIAIDAGDETKNIQAGMKNLNIDPQKVTAVFLTHSDPDHVAAVAIFKNAKIYLPRKEEQMINGTTARFYVTKNKINFKYTPVDGNEIIKTVDLKVQGIETPGHTPGAMCYLVDDKFLFTGDSLSLQSGKVGLFSKFINMDNETQMQSLKKLARMQGLKYIFTAHHGFSDNYEKAFADIK